MVAEAGADVLARAEAVVHAIIGHAGAEASATDGLGKPFELRCAIAVPALPVWRAKFIDGLGVGVISNAAIPVNRLGRCAASDEGDGKG